MNDFASQYRQQADLARQQYESAMQGLQAQAKQYQEALKQPIPSQLPVFAQQPAQPTEPPYTMQILAVLGDIKGTLDKLLPKEKVEEVKDEKPKK